jgi:hypothetical protein
MANIATQIADNLSPSDQTVANALGRVAETQCDEFTVRIVHRAPGQTQGDVIVCFTDATADHIAHPEGWLTRLGGGGIYQMMVYHRNDRARAIGAPVIVNVSGQKLSLPAGEIYKIVAARDWQGPKTLEYPPRPSNMQTNTVGLEDTQPLRLGGMVPSPDFSMHGASQTASGVGRSGFDPVAAELARVRNELTTAQRQLTEDRERLRERERQIAEERHKAELENSRRESRLALEQLEARITTAASASAKPQADPTAGIAGLIVEMMKSSQASSDRMATEMRASGERFQALMMEVMKASNSKPAIDPVVEKLLIQGAEGSAGTLKVVTQMAEAMGSVVSMTVGALHSIKELESPPQAEDPAWMKVLNAFLAMEAAKAQNAPAAAQTVTVQPQPAVQPQQVTAGAPPQAAPHQTQQTSRLDGAPAQPPTVFLAIVQAIKEKAPPADVAAYFLDNVKEPSIAAELAKSGGDPIVAFQPHLLAWIQASGDNAAYIRALIMELQKQHKIRAAAQREGFNAAPPPPVQQDEAAADGEEEEEDEEEEEEARP